MTDPVKKLAVPKMGDHIPAHERARVMELVERRLIWMAFDLAVELDDDYNPRRRIRRAA